ncbi:MAG TPA: hypothetical protein VK469_20150 [Candidatus Kapabacteria bacterium]|nr:hypothetical protein [Candidatus Kapabacteria bacterium]
MNNPEGNKKLIYMDVGAWQSREKLNTNPTMTFGLIEHNAIALCTYFSDGTQGSIGNVEKYDGSNICEFIKVLMEFKYNTAFFSNRYDEHRYHIKKILQFESLSLLKNPKMLIILIPDLHLHYFKDTFLDNFVTYRQNGEDGPEEKYIENLGTRKSMENDFCKFLAAIDAFVKKSKIDAFVKKSQIKTYVAILGDMYELWETEACFKNFCDNKKNIESKYAQLRHTAEIINNTFKSENFKELTERYKSLKAFKSVFSKYYPELKKVSFAEVNEHLKFQLKNSCNKKHEFIMSEQEKMGETMKKSEHIANAILERYPNINFFFENPKQLKIADVTYFNCGNHDNYMCGINYEYMRAIFDQSNKTRDSYEIEVSQNPFKIIINSGFVRYNFTRLKDENVSDKCTILMSHGHCFDLLNRDEKFLIGRFITNLLIFYESLKMDFVKDFESAFKEMKEVRYDYKIMAKEALCQLPGPDNKSNFKILVHAHTHVPDGPEILK